MSKVSQHLRGAKALIKEDEEDGSDLGPLLIESKTIIIDDLIKKRVLTAIKKGVNAIIDYDGNRKINVQAKGGRKNILVYFDNDLTELAMYICELCDEFNYKFRSEVIRSTWTRVFDIYK
jgi:hypothetical protein